MSASRPLLAAKINDDNIHKLRYPLYVSPKLDGIRMRIDPFMGGISRTNKPIPNASIQQTIQSIQQLTSALAFLDGELIVGDPTASNVFNVTQSAVMTQTGEPQCKFYVFDLYEQPNMPYQIRYAEVLAKVNVVNNFCAQLSIPPFCVVVPQNLADGIRHLENWERQYLQQGYEGVMVRSPTALYKEGRSTFNEHTLLKLKRFEDAEAIVIGFEQLQRNLNELATDDFGLAKRSSHKANKVGDHLLGALIVTNVEFGEFRVGSGFDEDTRITIWNNKDEYLNKTVSFKFQRIGTLNKPRQPIFKGFRHD